MISRLLYDNAADGVPLLVSNAPAVDLFVALLFLVGVASLGIGLAILLKAPESEFERFLMTHK